MLLVFAMKCCTKMPCPLPHNHYRLLIILLLASFTYNINSIRLPCTTCSSVHASSLHPLLAHHHLCYVDVYCVFLFFIFLFSFLLYATFLCDSILACLCTYFLFRFIFGYSIMNWFKMSSIPVEMQRASLSWKRAKRKFWGRQVLLGTKFLKFDPKRANLATVRPTNQKYLVAQRPI